MKRILIALALAAGLFSLNAIIDPEEAASQIGYQNSLAAGGTVTGNLLIQDNIELIFGTDSDYQMHYNSVTDKLQFFDASSTSIFRMLKGSAAADADDYFSFEIGSPGALTGTMEVAGLVVDVASASHTGTSNTLHLVEIAAYAGDANLNTNGLFIGALTGTTGAAGEVEYAINIGGGWDEAIHIDDDLISIVGSGTDMGIHMGNAAQPTDTDFLMYRSGGADDIIVQLGANFGFNIQETATTLAGNMVEMNYTAGASAGSITKSVLNLDIDVGNPTGTSNIQNIIEIDPTTGDANSNLNAILIGALTGTTGAAGELEYAINIQDGWDAGLVVDITDVESSIYLKTGATQWVQFDGTLIFAAVAFNGDRVMTLNDLAANESGSLVESNFGLNGMNGSDTQNVFNVGIAALGTVTGTGNTVNLFSTDAITGDANSNLNGILIGALTGTTGADTPPETEFAINIATGWDADINGQTDLSFAVDGVDLGVWKVATGTLTATQIRKMFATPVEVIASPGSGKAIVIESARYMLDFNSIAFDAVNAGDDLYVEYATGNTGLMACDETNCMNADAAADAFGYVWGPISVGHTQVKESAIQLALVGGEWATTDDDSDGNSVIHYHIRYRIVTLDLS